MLHRPLRRPFALAPAALVVALSCPALAQTPGGAANPATASSADVDAIVRRGVELRVQGRDDDALAEFRRAYALAPTPRVLAQIGLAEQALGRWVAADQHIRAALAAQSDPWITRNAGALRESIDAIGRRLGRLEVRGPEGGEVWIDGQRVATLPMREPVRVAAGNVTVELRATGYTTAVRTVIVPPGEFTREEIALQRAPQGPRADAAGASPAGAGVPAPPRANSGPRVSPLVWLGGAVALAAGGTAVGLGVAGNGLQAEYLRACAPMPGMPAALDCGTRHMRDQGTLDAYAVAANVMLGVSLAGAALAVVGLVLSDFRGGERRPARASVPARPQLVLGARAAGVRFAW